jgi:hypothetical protein
MELPENKRQAIMEAIYGGSPRKIEAIKLVREATGCGLVEAKQFVEKLGGELYLKEPQKFSASPVGKGCVGMLVAAGLVLAMLSAVWWMGKT